VRRSSLLLLPLPLLLSGCFWGPAYSSESGSGADGAESNVRAAIPALEAYNADHGSYRGATLRGLREYDLGVTGVRIVRATGTTYCLESHWRGAVASKAGPAADIVDAACPP
jgi:hypothetical protein